MPADRSPGSPVQEASLQRLSSRRALPVEEGLRSYLIFGIISVALFFSGVQQAMVAVAFPDIIKDLGAPLRWVGWIITIYALSQAVSGPVLGKLSDQLGRWRVFVAGLSIFTLASGACAVAPNIWVLIGARAAQGLAAGGLLPSSIAVTNDAFPVRRTQFRGFVLSMIPMGAVVGPSVGGLVVDALDWRWTFGLNVALGIPMVIAALAAASIESHEPETARRRSFDVRGIAILVVSMVSLILALTELGRLRTDPTVPIIVGGIAIAIAGAVLFVRHELRTADPIVDMRLLQRREFACSNALSFVWVGNFSAFFPFIPLYAQQAYALSSSQSGFVLTPRGIITVLFSTGSSFLLVRTGYRKPIVLGAVVLSTGFALTSAGWSGPNIGPLHLTDLALLTVVVGIAGAGMGISAPAVNNAGLDLVPDRVAAVAGMRGFFGSLGGTIFTAVAVVVIATAPSTAVGLQRVFLGASILALLAIPLSFGIPETARRQPARSTPAGPRGEPAPADAR